ncbi:probable protein phosphatase 2C 52 [Cucurbita pepo subsp. pepo]|uniref:probable protein phosphatase 2C 52 n=1 Tax=Cucurbita pepo subsp. pepo TaxID=3664 RepID=UPI000C9D9BBA|nr:probable protein phosphatase 2C 52 [Cucurbita pepo subsp. pepo]XP_023534168.1 probable protein phosphatase 2C 52 [Cucurbita pepo subsp. pepo]
MGICLSTGNQCSCNGGANGERISGSCLGIRVSGRIERKRTFSDHTFSIQHLNSIPNRLVYNGKTRNSCIFTQQGRKGINQDAMVVWEDFISDGAIFCGVFDGHGPHGHVVARKVRDVLPRKLESSWESSQLKHNRSDRTSCFRWSQKNSADGERHDMDGSQEDKSSSLWRKAFLKSYKAMDKELKSHPKVDCFCSGCTAVTLVKQGSDLFVGSIGDSRAILGSKDSSDSPVATQLTVDLKPDLPREAERIKKCKGRVFALQDEPEVPRVWLPFDNAPGLAMARAFGDFCLKDYGVISIPEFSHRVLTDNDLFVVLASDGVWDVLSNQEVVEIVHSAPTRSSAARMVVDSAAHEWKLKYPTSKMDDCAVVCLFLDGKMDSNSENEEQSLATLQTDEMDNTENSDEEQRLEPSLQRNNTVRSSEEKEQIGGRSSQSEENGESICAKDENWLGLEGVTRVNSLIQLPRFSCTKNIVEEGCNGG